MNNSNPYMQDLHYTIERIKFRILDFLCYRFPELFKRMRCENWNSSR